MNNTHNIWHPIKNKKTCKAAENCDLSRGKNQSIETHLEMPDDKINRQKL